MKGESGSQASKPVVSQFFTKPAKTSASASTSNARPAPVQAKNGLQKQPSIISLSDDDDDDELQVLEVPSKRKAESPATGPKGKSKDEQGKPAKKVKVAPLFEKTRALPSVKREGSPSGPSAGAGESLNRLQQFRFTAAPPLAPSNGSTSPQKNVAAAMSSSPLPDAPRASTSKADKALEAQRAQVRKRLLGIDVTRRPSEDDEPPPAEESDASDLNGEDAPVASTSKAGNSKSKGSEDKENIAPLASSRFANFASSTSKGPDAKGKGKAKSDAKGKGKAKDADSGVKYTPLEQQVLDIKKQNVSRAQLMANLG